MDQWHVLQFLLEHVLHPDEADENSPPELLKLHAEISFLTLLPLHSGHVTWSLPNTRHSNSFLQSSQMYSYIGI